MVNRFGKKQEKKGQELLLCIVNKQDFWQPFFLCASPLEALESWNVLTPHSVTSFSSANSCDLSSLPYQ